MKLQFNYCFEEIEKAGKKLKRLKAIPNPVNITSIVGFISSFLTKIINHRSQLKHYRTCIKSFREHFDTTSVDADFSESLSIPVKCGPQSLNWSQISRNSALWHSQEQWRKRL